MGGQLNNLIGLFQQKEHLWQLYYSFAHGTRVLRLFSISCVDHLTVAVQWENAQT